MPKLVMFPLDSDLAVYQGVFLTTRLGMEPHGTQKIVAPSDKCWTSQATRVPQKNALWLIS